MPLALRLCYRPYLVNIQCIAVLRSVQHRTAKCFYATKAVQTTALPTTKNNRAPILKPTVRTNVKAQKPLPPSISSKPFTGVRGNTPSITNAGKVYPERLLIYHVGGGRTVFVASFKLLAIFIFIFATFLIAPGYYYSAYEATWMAPAVVIGGAIPLVVMVFTTAPFVTYVHLALPLWARASQSRLIRYAQNLPSTATLDITSMRWLWPRVTRLHASELYIHETKLGTRTIHRNIPQAVSESRKWWHWRPLKRFYVSGKGGKTAEPGVWEEVVGCIARASNKKHARAEVRPLPLQ